MLDACVFYCANFKPDQWIKILLDMQMLPQFLQSGIYYGVLHDKSQ